MELKIEKMDLLNGINTVSKAVSNSGTMPILNCILLNALEQGLQLTGNNLELSIQTSIIEAIVQQTGGVALESRLFSEIVKKLPDDYIHITVEDKHTAKIRSGKSVFNITGSDPTEFPSIPEVKRENKFSIKRNALRDMIRQTIFAVSEANVKPIFTGELIKVEDGKANIVAIDGFRIAHRYCEVDTADRSFEVIVPGKSMGEIVKLLAGEDDCDVNIYFTNSQILFELSTCTVVSRIIDGEFFNYKASLEADHNTLTKVNKTELIMSLERACIVAVESGKKTPVRFDIKKGMINISSNTEIGTVHEEISAVIDGKDLSIAFNPRFLIDTLKAIEDAEVAIQYSGELSPCIIRPVNDGNYKYLVLPLRLQ